MFNFKIRCTSCKDNLKNGYRKCPQCIAFARAMNGVRLNSDDSPEYEKVVNDLSAELRISKDELKRIQEENTRLCFASEEMRLELADLENENHAKEMDEIKGIQQLSEEVNENTTNSKLQQSLKESETLNKVLMKKIEILEQRLNQKLEENVNQTPKQRTRGKKSNNGDAKSQENITKTHNQPLEHKTEPNNSTFSIKDSVLLLALIMAIALLFYLMIVNQI